MPFDPYHHHPCLAPPEFRNVRVSSDACTELIVAVVQKRVQSPSPFFFEAGIIPGGVLHPSRSHRQCASGDIALQARSIDLPATLVESGPRFLKYSSGHTFQRSRRRPRRDQARSGANSNDFREPDVSGTSNADGERVIHFI